MAGNKDNTFNLDPDQVPAGEAAPNPVNAEGQPLGTMDEFGVVGAKVYSGYVEEEFLRVLVGDKGRKVYREMKDNDSTIGAILFAIEMLLRSTPWTVEIEMEDIEATAEATPNVTENIDPTDINTPEGAVAFLESVLFSDMEHTWEDFIANVLTMLTFGWQYSEMVFKRRMGLHPADKRFKSKYDDGMIGLRKLGNRAQETLEKWAISDEGEILGMWQMPPNMGERKFIPLSKALLFRPTPNKDSPEGRSILRNAYRPWYMLKNIQEIEAIGIERDLNGLPVVYIPNALLSSSEASKKKVVGDYKQLVRDIKFNSQGGVVLPSDTYTDMDGKITSVPKVKLELLSAGGKRAIDTDKVVVRYQRDIARTVLADFIMLGTDKGSFALSKSKTDLFLAALQGWNDSIAAVLNGKLIPTLWELNGLDMNIMPYLKPGSVAPEDLDELSSFIERLSKSGFTFAPDDELENHLRDIAGLPGKEISQDDLDYEEALGEGLRPGQSDDSLDDEEDKLE